MPQVSNANAPLTEAEAQRIKLGFHEFQSYIARLDPAMAPTEMTKVLFEIVGRCYNMKEMIDVVFRDANVRQWRGHSNVKPFVRGTNPASTAQANLLESLGVASMDELNQTLAKMGLQIKRSD